MDPRLMQVVAFVRDLALIVAAIIFILDTV